MRDQTLYSFGALLKRSTLLVHFTLGSIMDYAAHQRVVGTIRGF